MSNEGKHPKVKHQGSENPKLHPATGKVRKKGMSDD